MIKISNTEALGIKIEASKMIGCKVTECMLHRVGEKGGRPNWEIEITKDRRRFTFTAFDKEDINGLHEVVTVY